MSKIQAKWEQTGLLRGLEGYDATKMAQALENTAAYLFREIEAFEQSETDVNKRYEGVTKKTFETAAGIAFPVVRRVLGSADLKFTWDVATMPVFLYTKDGEQHAQSATTHKLATRYEPDFLQRDYGGRIDVEVEYTCILAEKLVEELNQKFAGKHIVFYQPFVTMGRVYSPEQDQSNYGLATRYAEFDEPVELFHADTPD